ncbi:11980_t:CDS:2 [Entrophospora sp. SA101]|nr:11980_t:CDS:2 [Entrophospora sp. SA101]
MELTSFDYLLIVDDYSIETVEMINDDEIIAFDGIRNERFATSN